MNHSKINISNRRMCFFDETLIDTTATTAEARLHPPIRRDTVMVHDEPWEGNTSNYHVIIKEKDFYRMYYRGSQGEPGDGAYICYAESPDGIHWTKPEIGIIAYKGSKKNNIIIDTVMEPNLDNFFVFKDANPDCPLNERYKGLSLHSVENPGECGLRVFTSPDGIHFTGGGIIMDGSFGAFDSMNVMFWDALIGKYRCYYRGRHAAPEGTPSSPTGNAIRDVRYSESADFKNWTKPIILDDPAHEDIPLYTNNVQPYIREPQQYIGLPTRYIERIAWSDSFDELCGKKERLERMERFTGRVGLTVTECGFMASSDGIHFRKYDETWCSPMPENGRNWVYGDCYFAYGMIETPADDEGADPEISLFNVENYWMGAASKLTRFTIRRDGFVSLHADAKEKILMTKEFMYDGDTLYVNFATSARGYAYFTLIDAGGNRHVSGEHFGNSTHRRIKIAEDAVKSNSGRPVRLEVRLCDADLYSIRFEKRISAADNQ